MTEAVDLVIFGATGDLSIRKLLPALYQLERHQLLTHVNRIIATGRKHLTAKGYQRLAADGIKKNIPPKDWSTRIFKTFVNKLFYHVVSTDSTSDFQSLSKLLDQSSAPVRLFYFSTASSLYGQLAQSLKHSGATKTLNRVVLEKPLGHDLYSCQTINSQVAQVFHEEDIFRIDHYLGKETVQNLLALRFGNALFQPVWNNHYVDNIQITVAESSGVEGRGSYYAHVGALRDMLQNHLLQVMSLVAMEPPATLNADDIRDEKVKVLRSLEPITAKKAAQQTARGQYGSARINGNDLPGFLNNGEYEDCEDTETFVAIKAIINNWRWANVPFYLRTGKRLEKQFSEIVIEFKKPPYSLFANDPNELSNKLVIRIQPEETISLHTLNKKAGLTEKMCLQPVKLLLTDEMDHDNTHYDAYERLLLDAISGDQTLFMRRDEIETSWQWADSIIEAWQMAAIKPCAYPCGSMGPDSAKKLLNNDGRSWHE